MKSSVLTRVCVLSIAAALAYTAPALAQSAPVQIKEMKVGSPVHGTDGIKVGEVNRIKADSDGRVIEIQVTTGGPAALDATVISIPADKIASTSPADVKLSLSASDAKNLPVLSPDEKG